MKKKTLELLKPLIAENKIVFNILPDYEIGVDYSLDKSLVQSLIKSEFGYKPKKDSTCVKKMEELMIKLFNDIEIDFKQGKNDDE